MLEGRRVRTTSWSVTCRRSSRSGLAVRPTAKLRARVRVLPHELAEPARRRRDVHCPADTDHLLREDAIAVRIPVRLADAVDRRHAEVVRDRAGHLAVPGPRLRRLLQLLVDRADQRHPRQGAKGLHQVAHRLTTGAGVVPGCTGAMPRAQSGHSAGEYVGISSDHSAKSGTPSFAAPAERSTSTAAPTTSAPAERTAPIVSCTEPPVVMMSSTTSTRSPAPRWKPRRKTRPFP